jgi:DNA-binding SARP family transcriptional activator
MIELQTLGAADLRGVPVAAARPILGQPRRFALLAYLALARPYGFVRRDTILAVFWAGSDEIRARLALRQAIHHLRRALGEGVIIGRGPDELGLDARRIRCDARDFEMALAAGMPDRALELYRGDLLPGLSLSDAAGFENWLTREREGYRLRGCAAAGELAAIAETTGDIARTTAYARRALEISPNDENVLRQQMERFERIGDRTGALRAYQSFATRLATEWSDSPAPRSAELAEGIRARRTPPPTIGLLNRATFNVAIVSEVVLPGSVIPVARKAISLRVDADVLSWYRSLGPRYQTRMNAVLRSYMKRGAPGVKTADG